MLVTTKKKISNRERAKRAARARWAKTPHPAADLARKLGITRQAAAQRLKRTAKR